MNLCKLKMVDDIVGSNHWNLADDQSGAWKKGESIFCTYMDWLEKR